MAAVSTWLDLMRQSVTIEPPSTVDRFGNRTYGTSATVRCRIVGKRRQVVTPSGETAVSEQTVYLATADPVNPESRITISTGDAGSTELHATQPKILATGRYPDENGAHHSVVFL